VRFGTGKARPKPGSLPPFDRPSLSSTTRGRKTRKTVGRNTLGFGPLDRALGSCQDSVMVPNIQRPVQKLRA